jgi:hypothetical protein
MRNYRKRMNPTLVPLKLTGGLLICNVALPQRVFTRPRQLTLQPEAFGLSQPPYRLVPDFITKSP